MAVSGISWAGLNTGDFEDTVRFFAEAVGLRLLRHDGEGQVAHFRLTNGDLFEVFGPRHHDETSPGQVLTVAFEVEDVVSTRKGMEARGVVFVTEIETWKGHAWCYFQGPDGLIYEIKQTPR